MGGGSFRGLTNGNSACILGYSPPGNTPIHSYPYKVYLKCTAQVPITGAFFVV